MVFKRVQARIDEAASNPRWRILLETEYAQFKETISQLQLLQLERVQQSRQKLVEVIDQSALAARFRELERDLKLQRKRMALLTAKFYA